MLNYPLTLSFKIISFGSRIRVTDSSDRMVAYVKQKALKLKEDISIYADEDQNQLLYRVKADRVLDFNANYAVTDSAGLPLGYLRRKGGRSIWKATYEIADAGGATVGSIREENPWIKVADSLAGEIPVVGMVSGYFFNPAYLVDYNGANALYLKKRPALFEGRFTIESRAAVPESAEPLLLGSIITVVLLERGRG